MTAVCEPCKEACAAFVDADARVHRKGARDADDDDDAETSEAVAMGLEKLAQRIRSLPSQPTGDVRGLADLLTKDQAIDELRTLTAAGIAATTDLRAELKEAVDLLRGVRAAGATGNPVPLGAIDAWLARNPGGGM